MKRIRRVACLCVLLFFAFCETGHSLTVTLLENPSTKLTFDPALVNRPIVLSFGSNRVIIHQDGLRVPGKTLLRRAISLKKLYLVRDHRALTQRGEYEAIFRYGPFQLAIVPKPGSLAGLKQVGMRPITRSAAVTREAAPLRIPQVSAPVEQIHAKLDRTRYGKFLAMLAGDPDMPTRYACSSEATTAHAAIADAFKKMKLDQVVTDQQFSIPIGDCEWDCSEQHGYNVIAVKKGATRPNDYYVVGAHYDSINDTSSPCRKAPGANDNASGVAGVLELASVFSQFTTDATIVFAAFGGEEIDILGSKKYVQDLVNDELDGNVKAFVVLDMISFYKNDPKIYVEGSNRNKKQIDAVNQIMKDTQTYTDLQCDYAFDFYAKGKGNSDHVPFLKEGMPGALIIQFDSDAADYKYLHSADDEIKYQDLPFAMDILKVTAATLAQAGVNIPE